MTPILNHDDSRRDVPCEDRGDRAHDNPIAGTATIVPSSDPSEVVPMLIGATVHEVERELMLQTLARCDGNRTHAARVLGVSVRTMRNKIKQYSADGADVPAHG